MKSSRVSAREAAEKLKHLPYEDMDFARIDHHRHLRQAISEVVFVSGRTKDQVASIAQAMYEKSGLPCPQDKRACLTLNRPLHYTLKNPWGRLTA